MPEIGFEQMVSVALVAGVLALLCLLVARSLRSAWLALIAMVPWTFTWPSAQPGAGLAQWTVEAPLEPAMVLFGAALVLHPHCRSRLWRFAGSRPDATTALLLAVLCWQFLTTATSSDPLTSIKETMVRSLVVVVFYLGPYLLLEWDRENSSAGRSVHGPSTWLVLLRDSSLVLACSCAPITLYLVARRLETSKYLAGHPFFRGHIELGLLLAVALVLLVSTARVQGSAGVRRSRLLFGVLAFLLVAGVVLAGSRASYLLLLVALPVFLVAMPARQPSRVFAVLVAAGAVLTVAFAWLVYERNAARIEARIEGPAALPSVPLGLVLADTRGSAMFEDTSMTERYNRWHAAFRMLETRPVLGFGPGTFEHSYAGFQHPALRTKFTTHDGDLGDAHSHLLESLAEQGWIGGGLALLMFLLPLHQCLRHGLRAQSKGERVVAAGLAAVFAGWFASSFFSTFLTLTELSPVYFSLLGVSSIAGRSSIKQ